jgi:hypothetical protein
MGEAVPTIMPLREDGNRHCEEHGDDAIRNRLVA